MTQALVIDRAPGRWRMRGQIDERAHLLEVAASLTDGSLAIDLSGVTYVNSLGVRDWSLFLQRLHERGIAIELEACSEVMVHQMNMIVDACGPARVTSFHAPYACTACGWDGHVVLHTDDARAAIAAGRAPAVPCNDCGSPAYFTDFVERYFLFLT